MKHKIINRGEAYEKQSKCGEILDKESSQHHAGIDDANDDICK